MHHLVIMYISEMRDAIYPEKKRPEIIPNCFHPLDAMPNEIHGSCDI